MHLPRFFFSGQPRPARGEEAGPMEIRIELPGVKLGVVEADGVRVSLEEERWRC